MRTTLVVLALVVLSMVVALPALAQDGHECDHDEATLSSLHHCVGHALEMGHIDSAGVARSLHQKLNAAQAALDEGNPTAAIHLLDAFMSEVEAQSGRHIDPEHAGHLIEHAEMVKQALAGS